MLRGDGHMTEGSSLLSPLKQARTHSIITSIGGQKDFNALNMESDGRSSEAG